MGDKREVARVVAALDGDEPEHLGRIVVCQPDHRERRLFYREMEVAGDLFQRLSGQILAQTELPPEEVVGAEEADGQVGIRHGRFRPA